MTGSYYDILGVLKKASIEEIKRAYRDKARQYHPDVNPEKTSSDQFLEIKTAYEVLINQELRSEYDLKLEDSEKDYSVPLVRYRFLPSRTIIPRLDEDQLIYALLEIECLKQFEEIRETQTHICLVIDQSTSMKGQRIDMVKANVNRLLRKLDDRDLLSIVTFSDFAQVILPPTHISNIDLIEAKINQINVSGATELKKGLQIGIDLLWQGRNDTFSKHLILLTDGHTYGDEAECLFLAKKAAEEGIVISALGIGNAWNDPFLEALTSKTGGSTLFVSSKEDLFRYLDNLFKTLDIVYARKMTLTHENSAKVELKTLFQVDPSIVQYSNLDLDVSLGDLYYGKKAVFLMEFLVHPLIKNDKDVELFIGKIQMELAREETKKARLFPKLVLSVNNDVKKEQPPDEIVRTISRLTMFFMQERSREDVKIGNYSKATRRLNFLGTKLIAEGELLLAKKVFSESEAIQRTHQFSVDGEKELKYGTKMLLASSNP